MPDPTFAPPEDPNYPLKAGLVTSTVRTPSVGGRTQSRARWNGPLRRWKLRWERAEYATVRYLEGFFEAMNGGATIFVYTLPAEVLYRAEPALPATTDGDTAGGALGNRTYYVALAWENANGATRVGPTKTVALLNAFLITVTAPKFPRGVTGCRVYAGTDPSALKLEATIATSQGTWTEDAAGLAGTGAAPLTTSTMQESVRLRFAQDEFEPHWRDPLLADCELMVEETTDA